MSTYPNLLISSITASCYILFTFSALKTKTRNSSPASSVFKTTENRVFYSHGTYSERHICGYVIPFQFDLAVRVHWDHLGLVEKIQIPGLLSLE